MASPSKASASADLFQAPTWLARCTAAALTLLVASVGLAQPGDVPPPGLLIKVETAGRLQAGQAAEFVYLENVGVSDLQRFKSSSVRDARI